jgi:hypothetical protein
MFIEMLIFEMLQEKFKNPTDIKGKEEDNYNQMQGTDEQESISVVSKFFQQWDRSDRIIVE